jgi:hypothetical protein
VTAADTWREPLTAAAQDLAGLHEKLAGPDTMLLGPGGYALLPAALLPSVRQVLAPDGVRSDRTAETETVVRLAVPDDVVALRVAAGARPGSAAGPDAACLLALGELRMAWSRRLLAAVFAHLDGRRTGGERLLDQQLVRGALADAAVGHHEAAAVLTARDPSPAALSRTHHRIADVDRALLRLLGAHGFTPGGPGATAHLSELLADVYLKDCS